MNTPSSPTSPPSLQSVATDAVWGHFGRITNVMLLAIVSHRTYPSDPQAFAQTIIEVVRNQIETELSAYAAAGMQPAEGEDPKQHAEAFEQYRDEVGSAIAHLEATVLGAVASLPREMGGTAEPDAPADIASQPSTTISPNP